MHFVFLSRFIAVSTTEAERLLDHHSHEAIAVILNPRGLVSGYGKPFTGRMIGCMWIEYGLESHFERLRAKGMLTLDEMAQRLEYLNPTTEDLARCRSRARPPLQRQE